MLQVWECRSRVARTLIANKCITAFRVGLLQYLSLLWLCVLAFLGLNLGAKAAMVRSVRAPYTHTSCLYPMWIYAHACIKCGLPLCALTGLYLSSRLAASELQHHGLMALWCLLLTAQAVGTHPAAGGAAG